MWILLSVTDDLKNNILALENKIHIFMPLCNILYKSYAYLHLYYIYWLLNQRSIWNISSKCLKHHNLRQTIFAVNIQVYSLFGIQIMHNCLRLGHVFEVHAG